MTRKNRQHNGLNKDNTQQARQHTVDKTTHSWHLQAEYTILNTDHCSQITAPNLNLIPAGKTDFQMVMPAGLIPKLAN